MVELSDKMQEFLSGPAARPLLQEVLRKPERWAKYQDITFKQFAEVAKEAGYDDPEVVALAYESFKYVAGLSGDEARKLFNWLEGVKEDG